MRADGYPPAVRLSALICVHLCLCGAAPAGEAENLVPAKFSTVTDQMGFNWDVNSMGVVNDGSNDCFDGGMALTVNGGQFRPRRPMMTADGREFVLSAKVSNVSVTRRILVDRQRSAVRYLEVFRNESKSEIKVAAAICTKLGGTGQQAVTSSGGVFFGALGKTDCGLVTIGRGNRPSVMFLLADPRGKVRPAVTVKGNRTVLVAYNTSIPAGKTVSVIHVVAQRRGVDRKGAPALFKGFFRRRLVRPDVPKGLARTVVNFRVSAGGGGAYARLEGLQAVADLAEEHGVERGESDALVMGENAILPGVARCAGLTVETRRGRARVSLSETALLAGGGGRGRAERVFLRNGEILAGRVLAEELAFESAGAAMDLSPARLDLLFTRTDPADGKPPADAIAFVVTSIGERLAVTGGARTSPQRTQRTQRTQRRQRAQSSVTSETSVAMPLVIEAATAWGRLRLPLDEVVSVSRAPAGEKGQPIHTLVMTNGSRLSVILTGEEMSVRTIRFGRVDIRPSAIAALVRVKGPKGTIAGLDEAPEEVRKRLKGEVSLDIEDATFSYALEVLSRVGKVPVRLDTGSEKLDAELREKKVTFKAANMTVLDAVNALVRPHGLAPGFRGGAVVVTKAGAGGPGEVDAVDADEVKAPRWTLIGENVLVGELDLGDIGDIDDTGDVGDVGDVGNVGNVNEELRIVTRAGTTSIPVRDILGIERAEAAGDEHLAGDAGPVFTFTLGEEDAPARRSATAREGAGLVGRPERSVLPIRTGRHLLRVPVRDVVSFRRPKPPEKKEDEEEEEEEGPDNGEADSGTGRGRSAGARSRSRRGRSRRDLRGAHLTRGRSLFGPGGAFEGP